MTTRAGILWAAIVWVGVARVMFYAIWQYRWKRPTHVRSVAKAAKR